MREINIPQTVEPEVASEKDLELIWEWNAYPKAPYSLYLHSVIAQWAVTSPNEIAVDAWDGSFTYLELDHSSSQLAQYLHNLGVHQSTVVPLLFERSRHTVVAMLAVLKIGAAFVLLDAGLPLSRLKNIVKQVKAEKVLSSPVYLELAEGLEITPVSVPVTGDNGHPRMYFDVDIDPLTSTACIVFTSGTTGTPKGILLSHANLASTFNYTARTVGLTESTRMVDSASYGFDAAIYQALGTLCMGGCLCVPSDSERLTAMPSVINKFQVNTAILTPSVARLLDPATVPTLKRLKLVGESASSALIDRWLPHVTLVMGYGPSECAVCSNAGVFHQGTTAVNNIGHALGCLAWVVDSNDHERLLPIGSIGEMLIEGPNVSQGYLNDADRTNKVFVDSPKWLTQGWGMVTGRNARLYKTGDLVQYEHDGSLLYIGRKDQQKKLRGQRIDLSEIETAILQATPIKMDVIAEVCTTALSPNDPQLVALCCLEPSRGVSGIDSQQPYSQNTSIIMPSTEEFLGMGQEILRNLRATLPSYMVPTFVIPVSEVPRTKPSDKLDRKRVAQEVSLLGQTQLRTYFPTASKFLETPQEETLRDLLKDVLSLDIDIWADDHFFRLGGNSITAIQLIAAARQRGLYLHMSDILDHNNIAHLARKMTNIDAGDQHATSIPPFSLISERQKIQAFEEARMRYAIDTNRILDVLPCTPLQEGLMALGEQKVGGNIAQRIFDVAPSTELYRLKSAWEIVCRQNSIMRTRIIDTSAGILQVVMRERLLVEEYRNLEVGHVATSMISQIGPGLPLVNLAIVYSEDIARPCQVIWTAHHAACDGWQVPKIFDQVERAYRGEELFPEVGFNQFVKYIAQSDESKHNEYWKTQLSGATPGTFPTHYEKLGWANKSQTLEINLGTSTEKQYLLTTKINLAWSIIVAAYSESSDVVFGLTLTGRNAPLAGIESMTGPTITTVPFRHFLSPGRTVAGTLDDIRKQLIDMIPFEQTGLQRIKQLSNEAAAACDFQSLLVIQPPMSNEFSLETLIPSKFLESRLSFSNYPLTMECTISQDEHIVSVSAQFNDRVINSAQMSHILNQFSYVLQQIHGNTNVNLCSIELLSPFDRERLMTWNGTTVPPVSNTLNELIERHAVENPDRQAIDAWDGNLTYRELDVLASQFALRLKQLGVRPDEVVPVCLEKSKIVPVVMLAILKNGAACTLVDYRLPQERVNQMLSNSRAQLFICSEMLQHRFDLSQTVTEKVVTSLSLIQQSPSDPEVVSWNRDPRTPAFVVYTSGSTGRPKGVVLENQGLATSIIAHGDVLGIGPESRMLQFASCSFDINLYEHMTTLVLGGCVCIPSEDIRMNRPAQYARETGATVTLSAPTIMRALGEEKVPTMQKISLGGEPITSEVVDAWKGQAQVFNGYGPAECTICAMHSIEEDGGNPLATIGSGIGCTFWVVDIRDPSRLAPIGVVGELLIEGPVLARGYLNDAERTAATFLPPPGWMQMFRPDGYVGRVYKTGDLVRYNTDGTVVFVGRRDTQIKLRGQRIELSEVEHHLSKHFVNSSSVVAEVVPLLKTSHLVGFVEDTESSANGEFQQFSLKPTSEAHAENSNALQALSFALPPYMIPSMIIRVTVMPKTLTGKTDRKALREAVANLHPDKITLAMQGETEHQILSSDTEMKIADLWAEILHLPKDSIGANDNFFARGGDSIAAMRLVSSARTIGLYLTVNDVMRAPKLSSLAQALSPDNVNHQQVDQKKNGQRIWEPYHALPCDLGTREQFIRDMIHPFGIDSNDVSDVIPATSLQEFALSNCATFFIFNVGDRLDLHRAISSWKMLVAQHDVLRTVFAHHRETFYQVILKQPPYIQRSDYTIDEDTELALDELLKEQELAFSPLPMGVSPLKFIVVNTPQSRYLILRMSHSQYDGFSISELWSDWGRAFDERPLPPRCSYADFVYSSEALGPHGGYNYWKLLLSGSSMTYLTEAPSDTEKNAEVVENETALENIYGIPGITLAVFVQAAWLITLAKWTKGQDIVFGLVTSGRRSKRHDFDTVMGPCLEIMPMRAKIEPHWNMHDLCQYLQQQDANSMEFEGMELSRIIRHCTDWDSEAPLGSWVQHDNTDWNASLVLGGTDFGSPRAYDTPYGQDDVGLETMSLGNGNLKIKLSSPAYLLNDTLLGELQKLTCETMTMVSRNPEAKLLTPEIQDE
jgi:amino acid adenylation domain-containing protein